MSNRTVHWEDLAWPDVPAALSAAGSLVLWPFGATEQHGPHLGLGTDTLIARRLCDEVSARTSVPVLPALALGCSSGHSRRWPGTLSLSPATLGLVVAETGRWLHAAGVRRLLLVNAHVTNHAPLRCGLESLRAEFEDLMVGLVSTAQVSPRVRVQFEADGADWHANAAETSLVMHLRPAACDPARAATADDPDRTGGLVFAHPVNRTSANGVTGRPSAGSAADGARLFAMMADDLETLVRRAMTEALPLANGWDERAL
jgi:creatinine amidohydrolase